MFWQIAGASPDPDGTFVERFLHEIGEEEKNKNKRESSFTGESGRAHLRAQLQDMFIAGLLASQIYSFFKKKIIVSNLNFRHRDRGHFSGVDGAVLSRLP